MMLADAHLHLAEPKCGYPDIGSVSLLLSCSSKYSEWKTQMSISYNGLKRFYGIHPWYADEWNNDVCNDLDRVLQSDPEANVGEIGLDLGRPDYNTQKEVFASQVSAASDLGRTVCIHNVGCDGDVVRILKKHGHGCRSIILHSFQSQSVGSFSGINCYYSVGPRILSKSVTNAKKILAGIPRDRLLLESDAPHCPPDFTMAGLVSKISELMNSSPEELAAAVSENTRRAVS